jgi:hypothetical protein
MTFSLNLAMFGVWSVPGCLLLLFVAAETSDFLQISWVRF